MQRWWFVAVLVFVCFIILLLIKKQPTLTTWSLPNGAVDQTMKTMLLLQRITEERDKLSIQHNLLQV